MKGRFLSTAGIGVISLAISSVPAGHGAATLPAPEKVPVYQPKH
jgi:hypothetical protein